MALDDAGRASVQFPFEGPQKIRWSNLPSVSFDARGYVWEISPGKTRRSDGSAFPCPEPRWAREGQPAVAGARARAGDQSHLAGRRRRWREACRPLNRPATWSKASWCGNGLAAYFRI
jgi:hypothetical protein